MRTIFEKMISKSYAYNLEITATCPKWKLLDRLFTKNYMEYRNDRFESNIPKKIHQIWLGSELPEKYKMLCETWKECHPDWEYKLWTDEDVDTTIKLSKPDLYYKSTNMGMRSDILRYEILKEHGGLYVDTDFECFKPFDDLMYLDFFTGVGYDTQVQLYNGLIACVPQSQIIQKTIDLMGPIYTGNRGSDIINITGPNVFTNAFLNTVTKNSLAVAFPTQFFYPYPNNLKGKGDRYSFVGVDTYALHHWEVSWVKNKKQ